MPDFLKQFDTLKASVKDRISTFENHHPQHHRQQSPAQQPQAQAPQNQHYDRPSPLKPYWRPTFHPSTPLSAAWRHETGAHGWGNNELQTYTSLPENSHIRALPNGSHVLILRAIAHGTSMTSARLTSLPTLGRDRGYLCARITAPSAKGIWPAFWLLPCEPFTWPADGEIDIMESWNGEGVNHACLHWGQYNGPDHDKHRVLQTRMPDVDRMEGHEYGLAWSQEAAPRRKGVLGWYVDGRMVMRCDIPPEMGRRISEFQIKLNVAMGGNVVQGQRPAEGKYEMIVHDVGFYEGPPGGWEAFGREWEKCPEGKGY